MGIPNEDRLDYICTQDMDAIETAVGKIRTAISNVTALMGRDTWSGQSADKWGGDFNGRMKALGTLFDSYPAEEKSLIAKAKAKQDAMDRKQHGTATS
jgi:hypothetical protein